MKRMFLFLISAAALSMACDTTSCDKNSAAPSGRDPAKIQMIEAVDVPDDGIVIVDAGHHAMVTILVRLEFDLPDNQVIEINTALSQSRETFTHGRSGKYIKTVDEWKRENPIQLAAGQFVLETTTFKYIHVVVFRGFGPEPWEIGRGTLISALKNVLDHRALEREITFLHH